MVCTETLVASRLPFTSRMSPRLAVKTQLQLRFPLGLLRQFIMPPDLQVHQPETQPGEGERHQHQQSQRAFKLLLPSDHLKGQPPVAIGSSTNGVTSGGQKLFMVYCGITFAGRAAS